MPKMTSSARVMTPQRIATLRPPLSQRSSKPRREISSRLLSNSSMQKDGTPITRTQAAQDSHSSLIGSCPLAMRLLSFIGRLQSSIRVKAFNSTSIKIDTQCWPIFLCPRPQKLVTKLKSASPRPGNSVTTKDVHHQRQKSSWSPSPLANHKYSLRNMRANSTSRDHNSQKAIKAGT